MYVVEIAATTAAGCIVNELDLLLAEIVKASRNRRQHLRETAGSGRSDKINLVRLTPRFGCAAKKAASV